MRISELSRRAGVPVGTIKYYLREGLVPAGELTSATQARYDHGHLERLELIRVLVGVGGLSLASVKAVLAAIDDPPASGHALLGTACKVIGQTQTASAAAVDRARKLVTAWGWVGVEDAPALTQLAAALDGIESAGLPLTDDILGQYATAMAQVAELDVAGVPSGPPAEAVRFVVAGTVLFEPMLLAMRKLAQWDASARRFGTPAAT